MRYRRPVTAFQRASTISVVTLLAISQVIAGQTQLKRPLSHADFDSWKSIQGERLSRDGQLVGYALVPQDGDGEVVVRNLKTGDEWRHSRGAQPTYTPPDPVAEPSGPSRTPRPRLEFTPDGRYLIFEILPTKAQIENARKEKRKPEERPRNALGIMELSTGAVTRIERVKSFQVPEEGAGFVAYQLEPSIERRSEQPEKPAEQKKAETGSAAPAPAPPPKKKEKKEYGSNLVLRNLDERTDRTFTDVVDYTISKDARTLVFAVSSTKEESNGVYTVNTRQPGDPSSLLSGKGKYTRLTWDEKQTQLVFLSDRDEAASSPRFKLYHWDRKSAEASEVVSPSTAGFPDGNGISDKGAITFSVDGTKVFFGVAPAPEAEKEDEEEIPAEEKVIADLWHWKDYYVQPMQKVRAERERNRSYRAVFHITEKRYVQLADGTMAEINAPDRGNWVLGSDDRDYRIFVGYDTAYSDYYLVATAGGERTRILEKQRWGVTWSPGGKFALYYDGKDWNAVEASSGRTSNLTATLGVSFAQEEHDSPAAAPSYGFAGWTEGDGHVLVYDRYDIWQLAPNGVAKNLTAGVGRKEKLRFRLVRLDPDEKAIDPAKPILLRAENEATRDTGFYQVRLDGGSPKRLIMGAKNFGSPVRAKNADVYLLTASTFSEFPDLLVSGPDFRALRKVSDANPRKSSLLWGNAELIGFRNLDGMPLNAVLIKPEGFDPAKRYPLIVYIYERLSQGLHRFIDPRPGHSINASVYASNGYLVLMPDIVYTVGHPGESALKCVLPAIQALVDKGFVDESAIGIQGHSWGGYQIAYMITRTTRFKAASAGAPVANMTSAYSGIRWGTGLPRQFQYERTQSRIGGSLWESPMLFIANSPVFRADRVETPLLMLHNDNDDAVPWYQGIEFFLALRRLGKEVYMFNYNGEPHGLRRRQNQKDYAMRLQQFFDHYLKGAAKPEWMEKGIPYLEREKEKERYRNIDAREKARN